MTTKTARASVEDETAAAARLLVEAINRIAVRREPDGTPCWCLGGQRWHEGWIHAPACIALQNALAAIASLRKPVTP